MGREGKGREDGRKVGERRVRGMGWGRDIG